MNTDFYSLADCIEALSGDNIAARQFYLQQKRYGLPRINNITGEATFLWLEPDDSNADAVHLRMNRISDKDHFPRGLMHRIPGTSLWGITLELPRDLRASYGFCPIYGKIPTTTPRPQHGVPPAFIDPANTDDTYFVKGKRGWSIYSGPQAPPQSHWTTGTTQNIGAGANKPRLHISWMNYGGKQRRVYTYVPPTASQPVPVVTITDADVWFPCLRLDYALDQAINDGDLPPLIVTGPECVSVTDRQQLLGPNVDTINWLSTDMLDQAETQAQEYAVIADRTRCVLTGQSLGGMTALAALLQADNPYTHVLAQSPSLWWSPDNKTSPADWSHRGIDWITDQLSHADVPRLAAVTLTIGRQEGFGVARVEKLAETLSNIGWHTRLVYYNGGHDYAWWRGALLDQLIEILTNTA